MQIPVLIVGAGPTGLVLALWLTRQGIKVRIIDQSAGPGETSRAIAVQARVLEFYRQLGIDQQLVKAGILVPELVMRRRGRRVAKATLGALGQDQSPFPYLLFCAQDVHEKILMSELKSLGVEVERRCELLELRQNETGVQARLRRDERIEDCEALYLCGCDGAHSRVRHELDLSFPGGTYSQIFFVADVEAEGAMASGGLQFSLSYKDFCIVMPIRQQNSIRLIGIVPPECEGQDEIHFDDVSAAVTENTGLQVQKVNWFSSYHVHHRVATHFQQGRVFLAGDAGHIHSPAGGQGMNTGIGDAINLAWKLSAVLKGQAKPELLETYEPERLAFAKVLVKTTDQAFRVIASRGSIGSLFRAYGLPVVFATLSRFRWFLRFAFRTISQVRIHYRQSPLSQGKVGEIQAGDRLPWFVLGNGRDNFESLGSMAWQIHIYGTASKDFEQAATAAGIQVQELAWSPQAQSKGLRQNAFYLLRPDGHIGLAHSDQQPQILRDYLATWGLKPILNEDAEGSATAAQNSESDLGPLN